jgi:hypothetical protein
MRVVLHRPWSQIRTICERRRATAQVVLARLLAELPAGSRESSLIVECKARDLLDAIDGDLELRSNLRDPAAALEHALLYMHDNGVVELDKGRSVFRSAMTIQTDPQALKRRFGGGLCAAAGVLPRAHAADARDARVRAAGRRRRRTRRAAGGRLLLNAEAALRARVLQGQGGSPEARDHR